jgi:hypothetical protein
MTMLLDRIDSVPLAADAFSEEYKAWVAILVDSLNSVINTIEPVLLYPATISGIAQAASVGQIYTPTNVALTTITLPATFAYGAIVAVVGQGAGGWSLNPNTGQTIQLAATTATTSIASAEQYDSIMVMGVVANTTWVVMNFCSTGLIIT